MIETKTSITMKKGNCHTRPELNIRYNFFYSNHSLKRSSLRGIREQDIQMALNYSESIFKQGSIFHVVKTSSSLMTSL